MEAEAYATPDHHEPRGPAPIKNKDSSLVLPDQTCQRFTFAEIQSATHNFDETLVIGRGGFGKVYRCSAKIGSLSEVAVKRLHSMSNQGAHEFEAEVKVLSKLRHGNLVSLIGYCNEEKEMVLVYEFMPNGTLEHHLCKVDSSLSWLQRLKICVGAARGLDYLHTGTSTQHGIIHRDVKSSNILLDAKFAAKISDFGLAKVGLIDQTQTHVSTAVKGTFGYMDPSYFYTGKLTRKSDVYAFGVVLFEVLSGRKAVDSTLDEEQWGLAGWAQDQIKQGKLNQIIDFRLGGQISKKCLKKFASIASHCLHTQPKLRPTMAEVVVELDSILSQERESANSVVDEGTFIYNVRSFLTGKVEGAVGSKSTNQSFKIFTYAELESTINDNAQQTRRIQSSPPCEHHEELFCVCKLIPHTSLDRYLYGGTTSLSWVARLKIALGAAQGLVYLHQRHQPAYDQFKTNLIYVDTDFNALLLDFDFGSYKFQTDAYYSAPEWFRYRAIAFDSMPLSLPNKDGAVTDLLDTGLNDFGVRSEIYAFGVVLLEILTGMKVYDKRRPFGKQNLVEWATPLLADEVNFGTIIDPQLQHSDCPPKGAFKLAQLVSNCLQTNRYNRPSMKKILQVLNECYEEEIESV